MTNTIAPMTVEFDAIMSQLLPYHLVNRARLIHHELQHKLEPYQWGMEACTITAGTGRQSGQSTWIAQQLQPTDIVVVTNLFARATFMQKCPDFRHDRIFTVKEILNGVTIPSYTRCFVDEASCVLEKIYRKKLYKWLYSADPVSDRTIYLIG